MGDKISEMREQIMKINKKMPRDQLEQHLVEFIKSHNVCLKSLRRHTWPGNHWLPESNAVEY